MQVRMDLAKIIISETQEQQYIVLKERDGSRSFPIVIGLPEAAAIDRRLKGHKTLRPQTHELLASVIEHLGGQLEKIIVNELKDGAFHALLIIRQNGQLKEVDSRPSDAIALGVATEVPIYVEEHVLRQVSQ